MNPEHAARSEARDVAMLPAGEPRRIAWLRVIALVGAIAVAASCFLLFQARDSAVAQREPATWFTPYVDVTATPQFPFEDPHDDAVKDVMLSFVVASPTSACDPTWGGAYTLDAAGRDLDLDRRIARLRQRGGDVSVSFGGQANLELSVACEDSAALAQAYRDVIERYGITRVDLDVEGDAALAPDTAARRGAALAAVQRESSAAGAPLAIWLTLPVAPTGLLDTGVGAIDAMLAAGVDLGGVNIMTMDFGGSRAQGQTMSDAGIAAIEATETQLADAYARAGRSLSSGQVREKLGATPMIGQNDVAGERFSLVDAQRMADYAARKRLGRLSMWSLNRDIACGPNYVDVTTVSDNCSGVGQDPAAFGTTLAAGSAARHDARPSAAGSTDPGMPGEPAPTATGAAGLADDPATSPYQVWRAAKSYVKGTKVVWHRNVYQAKWFSEGDTPDAPIERVSDTPWQLIGPVLPGDRPAPLPTLEPGTYPDWSAAVAYVKGDRVLYQGVGYEAKWWTQADVPGADVVKAGDTPWAQLGADTAGDVVSGAPSSGGS